MNDGEARAKSENSAKIAYLAGGPDCNSYRQSRLVIRPRRGLTAVGRRRNQLFCSLAVGDWFRSPQWNPEHARKPTFLDLSGNRLWPVGTGSIDLSVSRICLHTDVPDNSIADPVLSQKHFGQEITVFGKAIYRPSGSLLRLDAEEILDTTEGRVAFSSIPEALSKPFRTERKLQTGKTGVAAFFGTWPGEETDGELLTALGELRH